jgi:actin-like ATPase involved in cell morphogenesis
MVNWTPWRRFVAFSLGVDVGTTYTAAALWRDGAVNTASLGNRSNSIPSVLFHREDGTLLVGEAASRRGVTEPEREAREFKRRMGDDVPILLGGQPFRAHELTGNLLRWVVEAVAEREGEKPAHVVLTCPAEWGDYRRNLLIEAAASAGLADVGLLPEPVAAATWYAAQERVEPGSLIGVYDLGGGTFDAALVRKTTTGFEIHGEPAGDDSIGGIDFDHVLLGYVASSAGVNLAGLDVTDPAVAASVSALRAAVVDAKEALSADVEAVVPVLLPGVTQHVTVGRVQFEKLVRPAILGTVQLFGQVLARSGVKPEQLRAVLLVGGSSRIPLVGQLLHSELGIRVALDAHPKYAVCLGAAIAAAPRVSQALTGPTVPVPNVGTPTWLVPTVDTPTRHVPTVDTPTAAVPTVDTPTRHVPTVDTPTAAVPTVDTPTSGWTTLHAPTTHVPQIRIPDMAALVGPTVETRTVPEAPVARPVDLAMTGLTGPTDVVIILPQRVRSTRPITDRDEPVVVRTRDGQRFAYSKRGLLTAAIVFAAVALVLAATAFALRRTGSGPPPVTRGTPSAAGLGTAGRNGTALATGQLVADPSGVDSIRGVTALPSGDLVAGGVSVDIHPRLWVRRGAQPWRSVPVPGNPGGAITDVAAGTVGGKPGVLAVGSTGAGANQHPAVWSSTNGDSWKQVGLSPDLAAIGMVELATVVARAGGGFLAIGVDRAADRADGDAAVFRSDNGTDWQRVQATGLDGAGPQDVHRVIQAGGRFVAVGAALDGAHLGPAVWTSPDGVRWQTTGLTPERSPALWALAQLSDGTLLTCGSVGLVDRPTAACWTQHGNDPWQPFDVSAQPPSATPLYLYAAVPTAGGLVVVGTGGSEAGIDASVWTLTLQPR